MILTNELKPGQKLIQEDLSEQLGVSRTPLLAAFSKLEGDMLIELIPRHGAYVRKCGITELGHFADICLRLEPLGAYGAAGNATQKGLEGLRSVLEAYRQAVAGGNETVIKETDHHFHLKIMQLSENEALMKIISSCHIMLISNYRGLMTPAAQSLREHEALFTALTEKDAASAERIMHAHIEGIRAGLELLTVN